jgi:hypothetical protein
MRKLLAIVLLVGLTGASVAIAQEGGTNPPCSPDDINAQVQALVDKYESGATNATTKQEALDNLKTLRSDVDHLIEYCANLADTGGPAGSEHVGIGTMKDPYQFGYAGDSGEGFSLRVTRYIRPADRIIANENMFNTRPGQDEVYLILGIELDCYEDTSRCESNYFDFELAGDRGVIYQHPFVVYDHDFDVNVFGGTKGEGDLVFLVKKDDPNLKLLYHPSILYPDKSVVYQAEPSLASGIQIQANASINVRSGPSTNAAVMGNLPANEPTIAFGRNGDGTWLQISQGWVFAELVTAQGDIQSLPITSGQ